jgi:hypothetical protein
MPVSFFAVRNAILGACVVASDSHSNRLICSTGTCCLASAGAIVIAGRWEGLRWNSVSSAGIAEIRDFEIATFVIGGFTEIVLVTLCVLSVFGFRSCSSFLIVGSLLDYI